MKHKKEHKKPKGFKPGSQHGEEKQRISDAAKQARIDGFAWLTYRGQRMKVIIPPDDLWGIGSDAFIKDKDGLTLTRIHDYKGERIVAVYPGGYRTIQPEHVFLLAEEIHPRNK